MKVRESAVRVKAVYLAIGITMRGDKEVLGLWLAQTEGAKFWLQVVTELRNRGVQDIFIACVDGLKGFPDAIEAVFPKAVVQLCIVHMVRHSLNYVSWKRRKEVAADLRRIAADPTLLEEVWPTLPRIALDHAVAEPAAAAGRVAVVPGDFGWDDVGDFASLRAIVAGGADEHGTVTVLGEAGVVRSVDSDGLVVPASKRLVAVLGLHDVVVVDTPDVLLVTTRGRAQDVKAIVAALKEDGHDDLV